MVNVESDIKIIAKEIMALQLKNEIQKCYPEYEVNQWYYQCSDVIGVTLSNDEEYITVGVYRAALLNQEQLLQAIKLKIDNKMYDSHVKYHPNLKKLDEIVEMYDLGNYIGYTDTLYVMPTDEDYDDAPYEFDISENGVIDICESDTNISFGLDEGVMVIDKLDRSIRVILD